jgi:hypothetical protein
MRTLLLRNFEMCDKVDDYECLCELFPNFPAVLPKSFSLNFKREGSKTNVTLNLGSNVVDWRVIDSEVKSCKAKTLLESELFNINKIEFGETNTPSVDEVRYVVSKYGWKRASTIFIPTYTISEVKEEIIKEIPLCKEGRSKSLEFFRNLTDKISKAEIGETRVDISERFYIKVTKNNMTLINETNEIEQFFILDLQKLLSECEITGSHIPAVYPPKYWNIVMNISCNGKEFELRNGDIVVIKKQGEQGGKVCIEKKAST